MLVLVACIAFAVGIAISYYASTPTLKSTGAHSPQSAPCTESTRHAYEDGVLGITSTAGVAAGMALAEFDPMESLQTDYSFAQINPATGLPMISDGTIDVGGNVFGSDDSTTYATASDWDFDSSAGSSFDSLADSSFDSSGFGSDW